MSNNIPEPLPSLYSERYTIYASNQDLTCEEVEKRDREKRPDGNMCSYVAWICDSIRDYSVLNPTMLYGGWIVDHGHFTQYLRNRELERILRKVEE